MYRSPPKKKKLKPAPVRETRVCPPLPVFLLRYLFPLAHLCSSSMLGPPKSSTTVRSNTWFLSTERLLQEGLKLLGSAQVAVCRVGNGKAVGAKGIDAHLLEVA